MAETRRDEVDEPFVEVFRTFDATEVQMVAELLGDDGLEARLLGTLSGAAVGVGEQVLEKRIEVPASQETRAKELVEAWFAAVPAEGPSEEDAAPGPPAPSRGWVRVVAGLLVWPAVAAVLLLILMALQELAR